MGDGSDKIATRKTQPASKELDALDAFCDDIEIDDMSFDSWAATHKSLDLVVPVFCESTRSETITREIKYTKCVYQGDKREKQSAVVTVCIEPSDKNGSEILFKDAGDIREGEHGDLKVIIRFTG